MSNLKKNIGLQMSYRILTIITPLITSPIISRALGAEKLGVYSATQAFANYFMLFAMLGIEYYGQRSIASCRSRGERSETFCEIYATQFVASTVSVALYYITSFFWGPSRITIMLIQGLWVVSCLFDINWLYFGVEDFKITVTRNFIVKLITVACIVLFVRKPTDLYLYAAVMAGSAAISQLILWQSLKKYVDYKRASLRKCKRHLRPIFRLFIPMIALSLYHFMDKTMLDLLSTETEAGYYYAADKIIYIPLGLITAIGTVMLPRISSVVMDSEAEAKALLNKSAELSICLSCAVGFGIAAIAKEFVPFFFGRGYEKCAMLLVIFVPVLFIKSLSNVVNQQYLIPSKRDNQYTLAVTGGAIVNLMCNWILIPHLGSVGATIGTLVAELAVLIISILFVKHRVNFLKMFAQYAYYILLGLIMFLVVRVFASQLRIEIVFIRLLFMIAVGGFVYCILCFILWWILKEKSVFGSILISHTRKEN